MACRGAALACHVVMLASRAVTLAWHGAVLVGGVGALHGVRWGAWWGGATAVRGAEPRALRCSTLVLLLKMLHFEGCHRAGAAMDWWHPQKRVGCTTPPPFQSHLHTGGLTGLAPTGHGEFPFPFVERSMPSTFKKPQLLFSPGAGRLGCPGTGSVHRSGAMPAWPGERWLSPRGRWQLSGEQQRVPPRSGHSGCVEEGTLLCCFVPASQAR